MKHHITFLFCLILKTAICQSFVVKDTVDRYLYGSLGQYNGGYFFDLTPISEEKYDQITRADSIYDKANGLRFVRYRDINDIIKSTQFEFDPENGPYGEYFSYNDNGNVKVHGFYQLPNKYASNPYIIDSSWTYFDDAGNLIGTKKYKNGLAHGKWIIFNIKDSTKVEKEFDKGFSNGKWMFYKQNNLAILGFPCTFHNGFKNNIYSHSEGSFETELDTKDHIYSLDKAIEIKKIKYHNKNYLSYIVKGKYYIVRDGIIIEMKEFKNGKLVKRIQYDYL
jgi:antitoxin component YwqK of YwqJK toxin-antitoxin module